MRLISGSFVTFLLASAIASSVVSTHGQGVGSERISLPTQWTVGDKYQIEIVRERTSQLAGKPPETKVFPYRVDVEVRAKNAEGYVFVWTIDRGSIQSSASELPMPLDMTMWPEELRVVLQTDRTGTPQRLLNVEELALVYRAIFQEMKGQLEKSGKPLGGLNEVFDQLGSPTFVSSTMMRDPYAFYMACGSSLRLGERVEYEDSLPNPLGGEPLPSNGYFLLTEVRPAVQEAAIEWGQQVDKKKAKEFVEGFIRRLLADAPRGELDKHLQGAELVIEDKALHVLDTQTGWPKTVEFVRKVSVLDQSRVDRTTFKFLVVKTK